MSLPRAMRLHVSSSCKWGGYALVLLLAPLIFNTAASLSVMSQMGTAIIFALSFNMLLGQGGMLSFGHAIYSGLGGYVAMYALNAAAQGALSVPVSLMPLVGGLGGMAFAILFGFISTRKSGTAFAMITLGLVELVHASALMFSGFFGGEGGIAGNRVIGKPVLGITFGPQIEVYYLIAFWLFVCTVAMYAFTQTPLGRMLNAVRDNPQRVEFLGYDPRMVRYLTVIISAFFAGISGGLAAINFEIVSAENVSAMRSASVLLFSVIGGIGYFIGPMIGAALGVLMTVVLSEYTAAWQLYLGAMFILFVMAMPGGVVSQLVLLQALIRHPHRSDIAAPLLLIAGAALIGFTGCVAVIEMLYRRLLDSADDAVLRLFGFAVDADAMLPWLLALTMIASGGVLLRLYVQAFKKKWRRLALNKADLAHWSQP